LQRLLTTQLLTVTSLQIRAEVLFSTIASSPELMLQSEIITLRHESMLMPSLLWLTRLLTVTPVMRTSSQAI
jgi:hypothetical protein